jgi:nicotinate-nucleotide pyrophosphorylase (carboxylating)
MMKLAPVVPLHPLIYGEIVTSALLEDLGRGGDLTTDAIVTPETRAEASIITRASGRVAGVEIAVSVLRQLEPALAVETLIPDGCDAEPGEIITRMSGSARAILTGERTALNLLGRLCGIATLTRSFVQAVSGTNAQVVCTRKTTPGLRALEKYAVRCGGGSNHRYGLDDAVLIKDNHIALAGGVGQALERARAYVGHTVLVEVEVDTLDQLEEALAGDADAVLLDNMTPEQLREAVAMVAGRAVTEASGGINLDTAAAVAASGVDLLSVGALTHSAPCLDLSLDVELI